jgi:hypothetical protein
MGINSLILMNKEMMPALESNIKRALALFFQAGNLIETSYSGGHTFYYTHDALNRLETVTDEKGTTKYTLRNEGGQVYTLDR